MSNPQPGWYPDPMGDPLVVRYWDGMTWTNNTAPSQVAQPQFQGAPFQSGQPAQPQPASSPAQYVQAEVIPSPQDMYGSPQTSPGYPQQFPGQTGGFQPVGQQIQPASQSYYGQGSAYGQNYGQGYSQPTIQQPNMTFVNISQQNPSAVPTPYPVEDKDKTLRMVAFIFCLITLVGWALLAVTMGLGLMGMSMMDVYGFIASALYGPIMMFMCIIPLAWVIPMTLRTHGIYKGKKPNSVGFGVCVLIFVNLVAGILLLCSKKDE